jgi:hypothetical protein
MVTPPQPPTDDVLAELLRWMFSKVALLFDMSPSEVVQLYIELSSDCVIRVVDVEIAQIENYCAGDAQLLENVERFFTHTEHCTIVWFLDVTVVGGERGYSLQVGTVSLWRELRWSAWRRLPCTCRCRPRRPR